MKLRELEFACRVVMPWNERTTLVKVENMPSGFTSIIPTDIIPPDLRRIGSRFFFVFEGISPEEGDKAEEYREVLAKSFGVQRMI